MENNDLKMVVDGVLQPANEARIPAQSRGLMYGDGCFETFCAYRGCVFKMTDHLQRLKTGLLFLDIDYPDGLLQENVTPALIDLLTGNGLMDKKAVIRMQVWREGGRGYLPTSTDARYMITATPPAEVQKWYHLATVATRRIPAAALPGHLKITNGINYITAAHQANQKGADDALMQTVDGRIAETTIANIFWRQGPIVFTPSVDCDILPGITRKVIISLLQNRFDLSLKTGEYDLDELKNADDVWICNSVKEIAPVHRINEWTYPTDTAFIKELQTCFQKYLKNQLEQQ